jgi:DNA-binding FrmR family transcriptional regulator
MNNRANELTNKIEGHLRGIFEDVVEYGGDTQDYIVLLQAVKHWFDAAIEELIKMEEELARIDKERMN